MATGNIPTLSKFGVPLGNDALGILHPKQKYRFRIVWYGFGPTQDVDTRVMTANVMKVSRPKITYNEVELHAYNSVAWIQGKHTFDTIEVTLRDDITNGVASIVGAQVQKQMNHYEQTSAASGYDYKFRMDIHSMDGTRADALESWILEGCWLASVANGEGDYSSGDIQEMTLTIRFDNATQVRGDNDLAKSGDPYPNMGAPYSPRSGTTFA